MKYYLDAARFYNHGCNDSAVFEDNGDGTATCIQVSNCTSCWQVGHSDGHEYARIGEVRGVADILKDRDLEEESLAAEA